ncbi:hypothetical protein ANANG_G00024820, partial [Anguilla anguilla]
MKDDLLNCFQLATLEKMDCDCNRPLEDLGPGGFIVRRLYSKRRATSAYRRLLERLQNAGPPRRLSWPGCRAYED